MIHVDDVAGGANVAFNFFFTGEDDLIRLFINWGTGILLRTRRSGKLRCHNYLDVNIQTRYNRKNFYNYLAENHTKRLINK